MCCRNGDDIHDCTLLYTCVQVEDSTKRARAKDPLCSGVWSKELSSNQNLFSPGLSLISVIISVMSVCLPVALYRMSMKSWLLRLKPSSREKNAPSMFPRERWDLCIESIHRITVCSADDLYHISHSIQVTLSMILKWYKVDFGANNTEVY